MSDIHTIWRFESPMARVSLGSRPCENSSDRAAVYEFQPVFGRFRPLQALQRAKTRSRCAVCRQFPSFHTVWVETSRGNRKHAVDIRQVRPVSLFAPENIGILRCTLHDYPTRASSANTSSGTNCVR